MSNQLSWKLYIKDDYGCLSMTVKSYNIQEKTGKFIRSYHESKLMRISDI